MTHKHYNKIADVIFDSFKEGEQYYKFELAQAIAVALKGTNPNYDFSRFYNACMNGRGKKKRAK